MSELPPGEEPRWLDHPENVMKVYRAVIGIFVFVMLLDFVPFERHPHFDFEVMPMFQGFFGFVGSVGLVQGAKWLRTFLMRDENYYDQ